MAKKYSGKPKKSSQTKPAVPLPEDTIEIHLPTVLHQKYSNMTPYARNQLLRVIFACHHKDDTVFGVKHVDVKLATTRDFDVVKKLCDGP